MIDRNFQIAISDGESAEHVGLLRAAGMEGNGNPVGCRANLALVKLHRLEREARRRYAMLRPIDVRQVACEVQAVCEGEWADVRDEDSDDHDG